MNYKILFAFTIFTLFIAAKEIITGKVIAVSDGDTFTLLQGIDQIKSRLNGVDCLEKSQAFGQKAKQFTSDMIFGKTVTVISFGKDRYRRVLSDVILDDGYSLNKKLIKNGFAWWYKQYAPKDDELRMPEDFARIVRVGLWADPHPIEPWNFRKRQSESTDKPNVNSSQQSDSVCLNVKSKKYHCRSCKYVKDCTNCVLVTVEKADREGEACGICGGVCR